MDKRTLLGYLRENGLRIRSAPLRSGAWTTYLRCPFLYMCKERLGLDIATTEVTALTYGQWWHKALEYSFAGMPLAEKAAAMEDDFKENINNWIEDAKLRGGPTPSRDRISQHHDAMILAQAWQNAAWEVCPVDLNSYRVVATELKIKLKHMGMTPIMGRLDALLYKPKTNELWVLDGKTCSASPQDEFALIPYRIQPYIYRLLVQRALEGGHLHDMYNIPHDARFGGFVHYYMQKPTIRILKKTQEKEGDKAARQEYLERTIDWFAGEGEFEKLKKEREIDSRKQPIGLHINRFRGEELTPRHLVIRLRQLNRVASCIPHPSMFPPNEVSMSAVNTWGREKNPFTPYWPMYKVWHRPEKWPEVAKKHFVIRFRDQVEGVPDIDIKRYGEDVDPQWREKEMKYHGKEPANATENEE